jgi:hypothetical protein
MANVDSLQTIEAKEKLRGNYDGTEYLKESTLSFHKINKTKQINILYKH